MLIPLLLLLRLLLLTSARWCPCRHGFCSFYYSRSSCNSGRRHASRHPPGCQTSSANAVFQFAIAAAFAITALIFTSSSTHPNLCRYVRCLRHHVAAVMTYVSATRHMYAAPSRQHGGASTSKAPRLPYLEKPRLLHQSRTRAPYIHVYMRMNTCAASRAS